MAVPALEPKVTSPPTTVSPSDTLKQVAAMPVDRADRGIGVATLGLAAVLALGAGVVALRRRGSDGPGS
jgi:hypothetical protein